MGRGSGIHWGTGEEINSGIWNFLEQDDPTILNEPEAQWHWAAVAQQRPRGLTIWRSSPREKPAISGWNGYSFSRSVFEGLDAHHDRTGVYPDNILLLNEINLNYERGDTHNDTNPATWPSNYRYWARFMASLLEACKERASDRGFNPRWWFPGWAPGHGELQLADEWASAAALYDGVVMHSYTDVATVTNDVLWYLQRFPDHPIVLGEWNTINHPGSMQERYAEEERIRARLVKIANAYTRFSACYFIYAWESDEHHEHDIKGNADREAMWFKTDGSLPMDNWKPPVDEQPTEDPPEEPTETPVSTDPYMYWSAERIAGATQCPLENVRENWPKIVAQLELCGINTENVQAGILGTIPIETASTFQPIHEFGTEANWAGYHGGAAYAGRGFVQLTHDYNYRTYGQKVRELWGAGADDPTFDLVAHPDNAMDPDVAAAVIALYFRDTATLQGYTLIQACTTQDWTWVRRLVQGGTAELDRLVATVTSLGMGATPVDPPTEPVVLTYNQYQPPERQIQDWACSIRALTWMLKSLDVDIEAGTLQEEMVPRYVTPDLGLLDGSGHGLAEVLARHLPAGTPIEVLANPTWHDILGRAGRGPIAIGSGDPRLYHWLNVAEVLQDDPDYMVESPNPAPNWPPGAPIGDTLTRDEFETYTSWALVFVPVHEVPDEPPVPVPTPDPPDPKDAQIARLVEGLAVVGDDLMDALTEEVSRLEETRLSLGNQLTEIDVRIASIREIRDKVQLIRHDRVGPRP